jgi:2-polyprenyl-3-methyl-5-hydroxy-6-metoxy-1,4-benzoquinol methylase
MPEMCMLRELNCPICGSHRKRLKGTPGKANAIFERLNGSVHTVQVARCEDCTASYLSPMVYFSPALLAEMYNIGYFSSEDGVEDFKNMGEKYSILRIVSQIAGSLHGKTLLDIGCGTGEYLKAASDFGMQVTGTDVDASLAAHIHQKYGYEVVIGRFTEDSFAPNSFDVIVLSHVIEHLQEPLPVLNAIRRTLKRNGLFVMCTPNVDSFMERLHDIYGKLRYDHRKCYYLTPFTTPYHIIGFNLKSSRRVLETCGFVPLYCKLRSGLEWTDYNRRVVMKCIKMAGALIGRGVSIVTVSRQS